MSDERILGDSDFVDKIITQSGDVYERKHRLKRKGFDLDKIADRVAQVLGLEKNEVYSWIVIRLLNSALFLNAQSFWRDLEIVKNIDDHKGRQSAIYRWATSLRKEIKDKFA